MENAVVVYKSAYGSTEKYARWISEELKCSLLKREDADNEQIDKYDIIIYGGGLYAGSVNGIDFITSSFERFKDKKIILFTCGLADMEDEKNINHIISGLDKVFTDEMKKKIKIFFLRGGIDYSKLKFTHKAMMYMMYRIVLGKSKKSPEERENNKAFVDSYGKAVDFTNKESIEPLIKYVREL